MHAGACCCCAGSERFHFNHDDDEDGEEVAWWRGGGVVARPHCVRTCGVMGMVTAFTQSSGPLRHVPHMSLASSEWFRTAYLKPAAEYQPLREALFAPVQAPIEQAIAPL